VKSYGTATPPSLAIVPITRKKDLTRRANQGHINIIARTDKARAEKSAAGFLFEIPIGRRPHVTTPHLPARRQSVASRAVVRTHSSSLADTRNVPVSGAVERLLPHPAPAIRGYGLQLAGVPDAERRERVAACVAQAGLRGFEQAYPSALSGGMRQRAALMRTLVVEPQVLLMDEPFGALDTHTKIDMHEVLLRIWDREQQTVLFVTHDLGEALTLADRIILFSARPGQVKDMFEVDIARPRDAVKVRETPRYAELFQHIWHSLGEEFVKGRSP